MNDKDFRRIANAFEELKLDPAARVYHEVMSDALVWTDEIPHGPGRELWCLRPVLRYRTGLILGIKISEFEKDWNTATKSFPRWIGFLSVRCSRSTSLEELYHKFKGWDRPQIRQ